MKVEIRVLETKHKAELNNSVELLNKSQADFKFEISKSRLNVDDKELMTIELHGKLKVEGKSHNGLLIAVTDNYLIGREYTNLFGDISLENDHPDGYCVLSTYGVLELLDSQVIELYLMYGILRYTSMYYSNTYLSHFEDNQRFCMFDFMVDKYEINQSIKTGNICLDCQIRMDEYLSIEQIFSLNRIARIIGRVSRSLNPRQLLRDYLTLIKESQNKPTHIESTISKLSRFQSNTVDKEYKTKIKNHLAKGNLSESFKLLLGISQNSNVHEKIVILFSRFNCLEEDRHSGIIGYQDANIEKTRIMESILFFCNKL